jgi:hypothetical protein
MTRRQLSALFEDTLASEPPLRDLVGSAIEHGRAERRRVVVLTTAGLAAAALLALVVLPSHGPWRSAQELRPAVDLPMVPLPDRFLPVPTVAEDADPRDHGVAIREPWAAVRVDLEYGPSGSAPGEGGVGWTGTSFAKAVEPFISASAAPEAGVPLGFDGPSLASLDGSVPSRWVETWLGDRTGVTGVWVQQWTLWPRAWQYCTDQDAECTSTTSDGITVLTTRTRIEDPVTHKPIGSWMARASTSRDLMIVVVAGPRTRAGVSTGSSRPEPLLDRTAVETLARRVAELGY